MMSKWRSMEQPRIPKPTQDLSMANKLNAKSNGKPNGKSNGKPNGKPNEKLDYAGLEVKKGSTGRLQRPRHTGAKIRARDKGKIVREQQITKMAKRKKRLAALGVTAVKKKINKDGKVKVKKSETDSGDFEKMVAAYKSKISAKL